jgi:hypothetical protein
MPININKSLKKFAIDTKREIENDIIRKNVIDTGDLLRSIKYLQVGSFISFSMLDYGKFVDEGTDFIKPRKFFNDVINEMSDELEDYLLGDVELEIEKAVEKSRKRVK